MVSNNVVKLGDVSSIVMGQSPSGETYNSEGIGSPLLNGPTEFGSQHPRAVQWTTSPTKFCDEGDILVCVRGSSTGRMNIANETYCIGRGLAAIRANSSVADQKYIQFNVERLASSILSQATGSTFPNIDKKRLADLDLFCPPLIEQRKIAAILLSVDDAITATRRIIDQTEVVKRGLMQELFTKGFGHTTFKQTEIGEIPTEWDVVQLDDIAPNDKPVVQTGPFGAQLKSEDFTSSGIPVLNIGNVLYGKMTFDKLDCLPLDKAELLQRYAVSEGDLLFSRMATVGRTCVVPAQCKGWLISYHLMRLSVDKHKCNPFFLMYSFIGNASIVRQIEAISGGGTRAGVNTSILKTLKFAMPPIQEQNRIVCVLESFDKRISTESDYYQRLNALKQGLMQVLLTGKVRVNVDEPSEVSV